MKKIVAAIVVIGLVFIAFFYLYSRSGDVYQSVDADLITLSSSGREDIKIEKRQHVKDMLDIMNQGKQLKTEKTAAPDYEGTIKFHKDRYDSFRLWIDGSRQAVFLKDGTYYKLSKNDTKALLNIIKKEAKD
ncbi:hypothetical protein [Bacillus tequilensis]|uniref:hypothetical protein n=1 Tax=Bacillus tequilensis TaxID=227866 RepID=UPI000463B6EA|nr:hypothetical protein [Bacillus tequilensis]MDR4434637.1 hypothetical protein [Bacillus tequilensis]NTU26877.1 hypothetical protein [Bacillus tequilensis]SPT94137.1 sporulation protein YhfM [Bacillus tequilensis]